jgi:hypothetical protein
VYGVSEEKGSREGGSRMMILGPGAAMTQTAPFEETRRRSNIQLGGA